MSPMVGWRNNSIWTVLYVSKHAGLHRRKEEARLYKGISVLLSLAGMARTENWEPMLAFGSLERSRVVVLLSSGSAQGC
jgi:hypothetical protein